MNKWDRLGLELAAVMAAESVCERGGVGAVLFQGNRQISSGYNGAPPGMWTCEQAGCHLVEVNGNMGCGRCLHAEENCILQCAIFGVSCAGATLYATRPPCAHKCTPLILGAKIARVVVPEWRESANDNWMLEQAVSHRLVRVECVDEDGTPPWVYRVPRI